MPDDIHLKPGENVQVYAPTGEKLTVGLNSKTRTTRVRVTSSGALALVPPPVEPPIEPPPVEPPPVEPPPTGKVKRVSTSSEFLSAMNDATLDVIELNSGTYDWGYLTPTPRPATKPLLVKSVTKWGAVVKTTLAFRNDCAYVTFDGISFEGNAVGDTGIVIFGGYGDGPVHHITMRNIRFRNNSGTAPDSHCFYLSLDRPSDITLEDIVVEGNGTGGLTALHSYHDPNAVNVIARRFSVKDVYIGMLLWSDMTGFLAEDWTITNAAKSVDIRTVKGTLRRVAATSSGAPTIPASITVESCTW